MDREDDGWHEWDGALNVDIVVLVVNLFVVNDVILMQRYVHLCLLQSKTKQHGLAQQQRDHMPQLALVWRDHLP